MTTEEMLVIYKQSKCTSFTEFEEWVFKNNLRKDIQTIYNYMFKSPKKRKVYNKYYGNL